MITSANPSKKTSMPNTNESTSLAFNLQQVSTALL